jgi:hypothetical protein
VAIQVGACVRPVLQRVADTATGETSVVAIRCGATLATVCPPCADRSRKLRAQQCREGWHLTDDPIPDPDDQDDDAGKLTAPLEETDPAADLEEDEASRRHRSTRRRQDVPDLPTHKIEARSVGRTYESGDGSAVCPSTFLTVTMGSYGPVNEDGTPVNPATYDYQAAALDALHMPKLWDRLVQNLRRAAGYRMQYFACVEPQRRLAPHVHAAIRGTMPHRLIRQVIAATYHQLWWPHFNQPVYTAELPIWMPDEDGTPRYIDPHTRAPLPTWAEALDAIDQDQAATPAHVLRFGRQHKIVNVVAGPRADKLIGYLTKYLTKSINQGAAPEGELTERQAAHARRLYEHVRYLPCSPTCANWLRYGITPANAYAGMTPGYCPRRAHRPDRLGCGGRRVLVSRYWTGKTLTEHAADRREHVRAVLGALGLDMPDGYSATELRDDGKPRYAWEAVRPMDSDAPTYRRALARMINRRLAWREQYEAARDGTGPPAALSHSATASMEGSDHDAGPNRAA